MQLIKISEEKVINPAMITFIQKKKTKTGMIITINVGGSNHEVTVPFNTIEKELVKAGADVEGGFFRI